jgi:putative SOS response-associated peptidase YedK
MCYNIAYIEKRLETLAKRYAAKVPNNPQFNAPVFHTTAFSFPIWPVLTMEEPDCFRFYKWGLIPFFTKNLEQALKLRTMTANCIGEEAFEKPSFRIPIRKHRCIVPVSGFFEWQTVNKLKYPYFIYNTKHEIISLAGVCDSWVDTSTGEIYNSFSIVTCAANSLLAEIHNTKKRMPLMLTDDQLKTWLNPEASQEEILKLVHPYSGNDLKAHTISKLITDKNKNSNTEEVIQPFQYKELTKIDPPTLFG